MTNEQRPGEARLIAAIQRVTTDTTDPSTGSGPDRMQLLTTLTEKFSEDEIATLAFGLHVDVEQLAGENKTALARSLILHCEQTDRTDQLIAICQEYRPDAFIVADANTVHAHQPRRNRRTRTGV